MVRVLQQNLSKRVGREFGPALKALLESDRIRVSLEPSISGQKTKWAELLPTPNTYLTGAKGSKVWGVGVGDRQSPGTPGAFAAAKAAGTGDAVEAYATSGGSPPARKDRKPCPYHCGSSTALCSRCGFGIQDHLSQGGR